MSDSDSWISCFPFQAFLQMYPQYGWAKNKGYPTPDHRAAIKQYGVSPYHRRTFQLLPQPTLFDGMEL